jgi:hypothetical protein
VGLDPLTSRETPDTVWLPTGRGNHGLNVEMRKGLVQCPSHLRSVFGVICEIPLVQIFIGPRGGAAVEDRNNMSTGAHSKRQRL